MPYDLCSPGLEGPEPSERKEQIRGKGTEIAEDKRQKCKVIGKKGQEVFSGRSENTGNQEAGQDSGGEFGALPSPCSWSREQPAALGA